MAEKSEYIAILFYSNYNQGSLKTRVALHEFIGKHRDRFTILTKEVNYDIEKNLSKQFGVMGTPALLIFKNQMLVKRHLGEISPEEFKTIIDGTFKT